MAAGLPQIRFHDGRHTALTRLAENGQPDWVIQAQLGHISPAMMRTYSHIRRKALDKAAAALEPSFELEGTEVTSQSTSQSVASEGETNENPKEIGSSGWTRTSNPPVNSCSSVKVHRLRPGTIESFYSHQSGPQGCSGTPTTCDQVPPRVGTILGTVRTTVWMASRGARERRRRRQQSATGTATAAGTHPTQPPIFRTPTRPVIEPARANDCLSSRASQTRNVDS